MDGLAVHFAKMCEFILVLLQRNIVNERDALWTMDSPFISKLLGTSQSPDKLFLIEELVEVRTLNKRS